METRRYALNYSHCYTYFPAVMLVRPSPRRASK